MVRPLLPSLRTLGTIAWALAGTGLAVLTALQVSERWTMPPTPPEVTHDLTVRRVQDRLGRHATFRILLFSDEFRWRLNSFNAIQNDSPTPEFTDEMKAVLNSAREIICVGASSEEIAAGASFDRGRATEEWRAGRRAEQIAVWVRRVLSKPVPVRKLNVGHHTPSSHLAGDTSDQRRIVIILVLDQDEGTDLDQSLRAAMAGEVERAPIFSSLLTNYSLAAGDSFTWVP